MIYVYAAIGILFISFIIALISLIREQKEISHGHTTENRAPTESEDVVQAQARQDEKPEPEELNIYKDKFDDHAKLRASHLETMFGKEESSSSTSDYEPFPWEQDNKFNGHVQKIEETSSSITSQESVGSSEPKLSGEISLKDIPQKS